MAQIFIAYAREDEARIQPLVKALTDEGWSVFWDRHIPAGQTWRSHIGAALDEANCVIAAWSRHSVGSNWVSEEADEGQKRNILVPVLLEKVEPPMGFRSIQAADLAAWPSKESAPRFEQLLSDIRALIEAPRSSTNGPPPKQVSDPPVVRQRARTFPTKRSILIAFLAATVVGIIGILYLSGMFTEEPDARVTSETAEVADGPDAASNSSDDSPPSNEGEIDRSAAMVGRWTVVCRGTLPDSVSREIAGTSNSATSNRKTRNEMEDAIRGLGNAFKELSKRSSASGSFSLVLSKDRRFKVSEKAGIFTERVYERLRPSGTWTFNPDDRGLTLIPVGEGSGFKIQMDTIQKDQMTFKELGGRTCNMDRQPSNLPRRDPAFERNPGILR